QDVVFRRGKFGRIFRTQFRWIVRERLAGVDHDSRQLARLSFGKADEVRLAAGQDIPAGRRRRLEASVIDRRRIIANLGQARRVAALDFRATASTDFARRGPAAASSTYQKDHRQPQPTAWHRPLAPFWPLGAPIITAAPPDPKIQRPKANSQKPLHWSGPR